MTKLFLLRHFKSQWNLENRFTGWVDVSLAKEDPKEIQKITEEIFRFKIDTIYSSSLFRNQDSVLKILEYLPGKYPIFIHLDKGKMNKWGHFKDLSENDLPVYISEKLNERYYGKLQGLYKEEAIKTYGAEKVHFWRRSYNIAPPGGESLKDVYKRTTSFFKKYIEKDLKKGKNVLIVASHNSLRALIKYLEKISDSDIINVEVDYGQLIKYEINKSLTIVKK